MGGQRADRGDAQELDEVVDALRPGRREVRVDALDGVAQAILRGRTMVAPTARRGQGTRMRTSRTTRRRVSRLVDRAIRSRQGPEELRDEGVRADQEPDSVAGRIEVERAIRRLRGSERS